MTEERAKRKLAAILSADVKGYSRLMGEDEEATVRTITGYREVMTGLIKGQNGRVVDAKGDNVLAEFPSVVDAVRCAVEIQKQLKVKNDQIAENRRMEFRIGINLGDVIEEEQTIYGDGVNIAARLEGLADGGGICISRTAFDQVKNKLELGYEYLGEHSVKNIAEAVRVYKVLSKTEYAGKVIGEAKLKPKQWRWAGIGAVAILIIVAGVFAIWNFYLRPDVEPASVERMAYPLPKKPSIAVLPFDNLTGDSQQEYLSDGMTEEIIIALSKVPYMFVIDRHSTFSYKGKPVKIAQVAEELGVRYVLEGSVRRADDRVRVTVQLIDAIKGHHLWAERYERELKDTFALQDEITRKILSALDVRLTRGEQANTARKVTGNLEAYLNALQAHWYIHHHRNKEGLLQARKLAEQAIALDPEYARPYITMAGCHISEIWFGLSKSPKKSLEQALQLVQKAISIDESNPSCYRKLSAIYMSKRQYERAIAEAERAIALDPNGADAHSQLGIALVYSGRQQEAIAPLEKAIRINPLPPSLYFGRLGVAYRDTGRYEEAIAQFKKAINLAPDAYIPHLFLASTYSLAGLDEEARTEASEVLRIQPKFSLERFKKRLFYKNKADKELVIGALRKAGLPEQPPLPLPDKPSIAVLPFTNMSDDPKQEYFSDGITESIITALSKVEKLFVIARNSTFTYKGKPVKVQQVAQDLGVQYILEGSVQESAGRIRITAQLIDARKGHHLWAERYDRSLKEIFDLQDEITMKIITALEVKLTEGEQALVAGSGTDNLDAYLKILQARDLKRHQTVENNYRARQLAKEAIALDPGYAQAYRWLGGTHVIDVWLSSTQSPRESLKKAMELAQKAISLDDSLGGAHGLLGNIYIMRRDYEKGIREVQRAVDLEPNGADAHVFLGMGLKYVDRADEAVAILKKAIRLDPHTPGWYMHILASAYRDISRYEEAMKWGEKAVQQNPKNVLSRVILCSIYSLAGRMHEARDQAKEIMTINPKFSVEQVARTDPQKNKDVKKRYIDALRKAGLK
ncbi:MAG: tetratricopeptide repeat protein [Thermodesulfobacteriota bacterium]|nr:tetratricopeptide repeat protein [Thermodesulfobacteriota bacterium]